MEKYVLRIELLSEAIFSGGESIASVSDIDELYDDYKIPYYKGKSIKGNVREAADLIIENRSKLKAEGELLFGKEFYKKNEDRVLYKDESKEGILKFENASLDEELKNNIKYMVDNKVITKEEVISSLTDMRYATKIDRKTGTSFDKSLRSMRVLNKGIVFYSEIYSDMELTKEQLGLFVAAVNMTRHLGTLRSRGKGRVACSLVLDKCEVSKNNKKSLQNIEKLLEEVVG